MLILSDIQSYYGAAHVLQGVSLNVGRGEIVGLLGRNGMGKTTTIRSIMNLRAPEVRSGEVSYNGTKLNGLPPHEIAKRRIALVPQGRRLFASLSVTEHLTMLKPPNTRHGWTLERAFQTFPRLAERRRHRGNQLSGGERQMLAVARALMLDPEVMLMDEPSEGLAPVMVQHLETVIAGLRSEGMGILLVEQNLYSALTLCDRIYLIETGRIAYHGSTANLRANPEILERYLGVH